MSHGNENLDDGKLDLVPMIDTVMLLLLFFILTTKFTSEERSLGALLPTKQGQGQPVAPVIPEDRIRVVIEPAEAGATVRVGGGEPLEVADADLRLPPGQALDAALARLHAGIAQRLAAYEIAGSRQQQVPIDVHCYTRLPWRFALTAYDAVRGFERGRGERAEDLREIALAAPVIRDHREDAPARELAFLRALR